MLYDFASRSQDDQQISVYHALNQCQPKGVWQGGRVGVRFAPLLLALLGGCAAAPTAAPAPVPSTQPVVPAPECYAANANLRGLEAFYLARTEPGRVCILVMVDYRYGEPFACSDTGAIVPLSDLTRYVAKVTRKSIECVLFPVPLKCDASI